MTAHNEERQVFDRNGSPMPDVGIDPGISRQTPEVIVGAVHVWMWRITDKGMEVLLQKRAANKPTWPGKYDISAAGHIDKGESPIEAAVRECKEEIGIIIEPRSLEYIFSYRNFSNGIKWVYLYELDMSTRFSFMDGEVESLEWKLLDEFESLVSKPEENDLVPHIPEYFSLLLKGLKMMYENH